MRVFAEAEGSRLPRRTPENEATRSKLRLVVDCIGIAETFIYGRIRDIIDRHIETLNDPVLNGLYKSTKAIDSSWDSIRGAGKAYLGIDIYQPDSYQVFAGLVQIRNAVVHGGGSLTRQQLKQRQEVVRKIEVAGFLVREDEIHPPSGQMLHVAQYCREMIISVDRLTWSSDSGLAKVR